MFEKPLRRLRDVLRNAARVLGDLVSRATEESDSPTSGSLHEALSPLRAPQQVPRDDSGQKIPDVHKPDSVIELKYVSEALRSQGGVLVSAQEAPSGAEVILEIGLPGPKKEPALRCLFADDDKAQHGFRAAQLALKLDLRDSEFRSDQAWVRFLRR